MCCSSFHHHGWTTTASRARQFVFCYSDRVFLKRRVLFVFTWWQLNNPAVREFGRGFIDTKFFFWGRRYWLVKVMGSERKWKKKVMDLGLFPKLSLAHCSAVFSIQPHLWIIKGRTWTANATQREETCFSLPCQSHQTGICSSR